MRHDQLTQDILGERNGWHITRDQTGRAGQRLIDAARMVDGCATAVVELREGVRRDYNAQRDYWASAPTGQWRRPYVRPCFAPGVAL